MDRLSICNQALDEVPEGTVASINEDSVAARACGRLYAPTLAELLEAHDWGFARKRVSLPLLATNDRESAWGYAYSLPADLSLPIRVLPLSPAYGAVLTVGQTLASHAEGTGAAYDYAGDTLYTNAEAAVLEYVSGQVDATATAAFSKALVLTLAAKLVMPITKDRRQQEAIERKAEIAVQRAIANDANRRPRRYMDGYVPEVLAARWT